jgi:hypothetical protein
MGFFDLPEPPYVDDAPEEEDEYVDPTTRYVGGLWAESSRVIARTAEVAVVLNRIVAFPDGFEVTIGSYARGEVEKEMRRSYGPERHHRQEGGTLSEKFLRIGLQFPDGTKLTNIDFMPGVSMMFRTEEPAAGMDPLGGSGNGSDWTETFWVWPIPAEGDVDLVVEWLAYGVLETRISLDGDELRRLSRESRPVWPDADGAPSHFSRWSRAHADNENESK